MREERLISKYKSSNTFYCYTYGVPKKQNKGYFISYSLTHWGRWDIFVIEKNRIDNSYT